MFFYFSRGGSHKLWKEYFLAYFCFLPALFSKKWYQLLLQAEWYNFLHSPPRPGWRSSWNWRMFIFDNYNEVQFIPNIIFFLNSLNLVWYNIIIKLLNMWKKVITRIKFVNFLEQNINCQKEFNFCLHLIL